VLEPIATDGLTKRDVNALKDRTRGAIAEALETMRAERSAVR
jgi:hydrogenase maturation factor